VPASGLERRGRDELDEKGPFVAEVVYVD